MSFLNIAFIQNLSGFELILIFSVILLFFGAKRLPELSESLGKSLRRFKKATSEVEDEVKSALQEESKPKKQDSNSTSKSDNSNPSEL
mgnify:CR=1 FL=1|tara:strand:+ start:215 stop:478 length:264 start_codon:yes stop_codon:yes gene_type:complete